MNVILGALDALNWNDRHIHIYIYISHSPINAAFIFGISVLQFTAEPTKSLVGGSLEKEYRKDECIYVSRAELPAFSLAERTYYAVQELQLGKRCVQLRI